MTPALWTHGKTAFKTKFPFLQMLRGVCVSGAIFLTYLAYRYLPTHTAATLGTSGPLLTIVLSTWILKESLSYYQMRCLALGYVGVLCVIQPHQMTLNPFMLSSLGANILVAISSILARILVKHQENMITALFYAILMPLLIYSGTAFLFWVPLNGKALISLVALGGFGSLAQICFFSALKQAPAAFLAPFEYLRLCLLLPLAWFFFDELPTSSTYIGAFLIMLSSIFLSMKKNQTSS